MKLKDSFHPYAFTTIFFWSLSYILTRLALQAFGPFSLAFLRYLIAACLLVVVVIVKKMPMPRRQDIPWFLLAGATGFFLYMVTFNQGQGLVSASTGSVMVATSPVITALLARIIYKEELRPFQWVAILVSFAGVAVLALMNGTFSVNGGLFWLLLAALSLSSYNVLQRKLTARYTALQTSTYSVFAGALLLTVFAPPSFGELRAASPIHLVYLAILGVGASAIAYVTWSIAFSKAQKTSQVSNYMFFTPFLASILGFLLAREVPDRATLLGGGIIILGVLIFNFGESLYKVLCAKVLRRER